MRRSEPYASDTAEILAEARLNIHAAVAECGNRRRMFAHHAATLSADAALHRESEPSQRATALCYLDETAGLPTRKYVVDDPHHPTRHGGGVVVEVIG